MCIDTYDTETKGQELCPYFYVVLLMNLWDNTYKNMASFLQLYTNWYPYFNKIILRGGVKWKIKRKN